MPKILKEGHVSDNTTEEKPQVLDMLSSYICLISYITTRQNSRLIILYHEVKREWRKLHNEELNDLYTSPSIFRVIKSRIMRWVGHVARMGERRDLYRVLMGKPEGRRRFGRPWDDNIKMDLQEVACRGMGWIELALDRDRWLALMNAVMNLWVS